MYLWVGNFLHMSNAFFTICHSRTQAYLDTPDSLLWLLLRFVQRKGIQAYLDTPDSLLWLLLRFVQRKRIQAYLDTLDSLPWFPLQFAQFKHHEPGVS